MLMINTGNEKRIGVNRLLLFLSGLTLINFAAAPVWAQGILKNQSCKGRSGIEINQKVLEDGIEKFRKKEIVELPRLFLCREALPTLKKYALDPDPRVRDEITKYLDDHYSPEALQALIRQVETYPSYPSAFPAFYAAKYPCYFFRKVKAPSLTQALTNRIKSRADAFKREEIYLLGCLAPRDARARDLLKEMSRPSFPLRLSEEDREVFSKLVTYALAEAGMKEAEEKVLADIESQSKTGDPDGISSVLEELKQFTNCRILLRYAQFITDKRPGRETPKISDINDPRYKTDNSLVQRRIGDEAILRFASIYGTEVTGIDENDFRGAKTYTDEEMERVYRRVKKALEGGKFSTCRSRK